MPRVFKLIRRKFACCGQQDQSVCPVVLPNLQFQPILDADETGEEFNEIHPNGLSKNNGDIYEQPMQSQISAKYSPGHDEESQKSEQLFSQSGFIAGESIRTVYEKSPVASTFKRQPRSSTGSAMSTGAQTQTDGKKCCGNYAQAILKRNKHRRPPFTPSQGLQTTLSPIDEEYGTLSPMVPRSFEPLKKHKTLDRLDTASLFSQEHLDEPPPPTILEPPPPTVLEPLPPPILEPPLSFIGPLNKPRRTQRSSRAAEHGPTSSLFTPGPPQPPMLEPPLPFIGPLNKPRRTQRSSRATKQTEVSSIDQPSSPHMQEEAYTLPIPPSSSSNFVNEVDIDNKFDSHLVYSLNRFTFTDFLRDKIKAIVMFYGDSCAEETKHTNKFNSASKHTQNIGHAFAAVDCSVENGLCTREKVGKTPMFKLYSNGKTQGALRDPEAIDTHLMMNIEALFSK